MVTASLMESMNRQSNIDLLPQSIQPSSMRRRCRKVDRAVIELANNLDINLSTEDRIKIKNILFDRLKQR